MRGIHRPEVSVSFHSDSVSSAASRTRSVAFPPGGETDVPTVEDEHASKVS